MRTGTGGCVAHALLSYPHAAAVECWGEDHTPHCVVFRRLPAQVAPGFWGSMAAATLTVSLPPGLLSCRSQELYCHLLHLYCRTCRRVADQASGSLPSALQSPLGSTDRQAIVRELVAHMARAPTSVARLDVQEALMAVVACTGVVAGPQMGKGGSKARPLKLSCFPTAGLHFERPAFRGVLVFVHDFRPPLRLLALLAQNKSAMLSRPTAPLSAQRPWQRLLRLQPGPRLRG